MTLKTIRCYLKADENTLRQVWEEMAQKNTPLILCLLEQIKQHPDFESWMKNGSISKSKVVEIRNSLIQNTNLKEQAGRLRTSAGSLVTEIYAGWSELH